MNENKRFAFLITNGEDTHLITGYGANEEEAEKYLSLNSHWSVVKDLKAIEKFIREEEKTGFEFEGLSSSLYEQLARYKADLDLLKQSLKDKEEKQMNIEQKLEVIRKALELGANVDVGFYNVHKTTSREDALSIISELGEMTGETPVEKNFDGANWFKIENYYKKQLSISVHFNPVKDKEQFVEDDVYVELELA